MENKNIAYVDWVEELLSSYTENLKNYVNERINNLTPVISKVVKDSTASESGEPDAVKTEIVPSEDPVSTATIDVTWKVNTTSLSDEEIYNAKEDYSTGNARCKTITLPQDARSYIVGLSRNLGQAKALRDLYRIVVIAYDLDLPSEETYNKPYFIIPKIKERGGSYKIYKFREDSEEIFLPIGTAAYIVYTIHDDGKFETESGLKSGGADSFIQKLYKVNTKVVD